MTKRPFFGIAPKKLSYTVVSDIRAGSSEDVPAPRKAVFFVDRPFNAPALALASGDTVARGAVIRPYKDGEGYFVCSVSGQVSGIAPYTDARGRKQTSVTVEAKGGEERQTVAGPAQDLATALGHLENCPGGLKLSRANGKGIKTVVVLGMDQDLFSTAAQQVVRDFGAEIAAGVGALKKILGAADAVMVAPAALQKDAQAAGVEVKVLSTAYPDALPALVMSKLFNATLPAGSSPEDAGFFFVTAEAAASVGAFFKTGRVPDEKMITVVPKESGAKLQNFRARVGAPVADVLAAANVVVNGGDRVVLGGPMRGAALFSTDQPVLPDTDVIMVQAGETLAEISDNPCINCGDCVRVCPAKMAVNMLIRYLENGQYRPAADLYDLFSCVECGLCAFVCPARIPILQYIMLGKHEIAVEEAQA
ncbi:MAG: 4Fe-4S dicluster domain-containing protein [Thermodesulfobacteriota bacterium]